MNDGEPRLAKSNHALDQSICVFECRSLDCLERQRSALCWKLIVTPAPLNLALTQPLIIAPH